MSVNYLILLDHTYRIGAWLALISTGFFTVPMNINSNAFSCPFVPSNFVIIITEVKGMGDEKEWEGTVLRERGKGNENRSVLGCAPSFLN